MGATVTGLPRLPSPRLVLVAAVLLAPLVARADGLFHNSSASFLYGTNFHDTSVGNATRTGRMSTVTLENFTEFPLGDSFFFIDLLQGDFRDDASLDYQIYTEWNPRLSLSKMFGTKVGVGPLKDVLLAYEHDRNGAGFAANNLGVGFDFVVPGFAVLTFNAYYRDDNFNPGTFQLTFVWFSPFETGPLRWTFGGFMDVVGIDGGGLDVMFQPQLLFDVGRLTGLEPDRIKVGTEWYLHRTNLGLRSAPQAMVRFAY